MNNNPTAKTLDEALEREFFNFGNTDAGNLCRVYVNFKGDFINGSAIGIACGASKPTNYNDVYKQVFVTEYWGNMQLYLTDKIRQNHGKVIDFQILGRPITLFDVLNLLNTNKKDHIYIAKGLEIHQIIHILPVGKFCDFNTNLLEEQTPETWEKIANLFN
jgi:hypothetical protein